VLDSGPAPQLDLLETKTIQLEAKVSLTVRITSQGGGIGEKLIWRVNGKAQGDRTPPALKGLATGVLATTTVTQTLIVDPGDTNIVDIIAYNGKGLLATVPLHITVDKFGVTTKERPRMYVLAIGVNKYRTPDLVELKHAVNDAKQFEEALEKVGSSLFAAVEGTVLPENEATKGGISAAFDKIAANANPNDVFVLFLSGHGKSVGGRYYYYPQDFSTGQTYRNGIGQDLWEKWLDKIGHIKKTLLLLDTCESGAAGALVREQGLGAIRRTAMEQLEHATGNNLIAAAGSLKPAIEGYKGHGLLTYALLEALTKKEGERGGEEVEVGTLADYVDKRVPEIAKAVWQEEQLPVRKLSGNNFPIGFRVAGLLKDYIPSEPTHVLIRDERVREMPALDAPGELPLKPGMQVRLLDLNGTFAVIARAGEKLGYIPSDAIAPLQ
jgi:hypothetical protein